MTPYEIRAYFREIGAPLGFRETEWRIMHGDYDLQLERRTADGVISFYAIFDGHRRLTEVFVVDDVLIGQRHDVTGGGVTLLAAGHVLLERFGVR